MNRELKAYLKAESILTAAFTFFIQGFFVALIYHGADNVPVDPVSLAFDMAVTCLPIAIPVALLSRASVRRTKTAGLVTPGGHVLRFFGGLFRHPALFGAVTGLITALALTLLLGAAFTLLGITTLPFYGYVALKCIVGSLSGGGFNAWSLYAGLCMKGDSAVPNRPKHGVAR